MNSSKWKHWGIGGVVGLFGYSGVRLGSMAYSLSQPTNSLLTYYIGGITVLFSISEARHINNNFTPSVLARANTITHKSPFYHKILAPLYVMGGINTDRYQMMKTWITIGWITTSSYFIRMLSEDCRAFLYGSTSGTLLLSTLYLIHMWRCKIFKRCI
uniref:Uncharacterized protein n=1 Tax=Megaviridae environmental sample TaxID=1737588 RepID=A0A5J6VI85_9VIRU|nr:MAG: hypothetical protein [Megaviridae environmental sample]